MKDIEYFHIAQRIHNPEGLIPPPHFVKQLVVREYAWKYDLKIFVETGTYLGDMVEAMRPYFDQIYSIELSKIFYRRAKKRFGISTRIRLFKRAKKTRLNRRKKPQLILGDSGKELGNLIPYITQPCLFWLDGHNSGGNTAKGVKNTPVCDELNHILTIRHGRYVVLIDDARDFGTAPDYPTLDEIATLVQRAEMPHHITVKDNIIRIVPTSMETEAGKGTENPAGSKTTPK